ncbi:helix-turn-helix domain-containing protein [Listeria monocytogenes]|nr:helix-turn-helix domain-containing protein [Listeria monocytogenes]EAC7182568.1 helix-turn-helix domain-containing protein [Listeria monocytogenes]EAC8000781.1 helix-turn-helix domain-containing protein [Listeria monocytogenes]EAC8001297.1 helix-turn-helix domain-containing protein [Listeria monocytogenes]EAC9519043.1 helix-turn-helix domain-containing protein [Listeria monocytogenes]
MKSKKEMLSFSVIVLAIQGDVSAMNKVLKHFEPYVNKLSQKTLFDGLGNSYIYVEPEIKRILETKLITAILNFKLG